jgi:hypothetical protein
MQKASNYPWYLNCKRNDGRLLDNEIRILNFDNSIGREGGHSSISNRVGNGLLVLMKVDCRRLRSNYVIEMCGKEF